MEKEVEFVITVPEDISTEICIKTNARQTVSVLIEIFVKAKTYVVISSPFLQDFAIVNKNLETAILAAISRGVQLRIISTENSLDDLDLKRFGRGIKVYQPVDNVEDSKVLGSHAKFCLADGAIVYLGSANITQPGLGKHIEMGVFAGKGLASKVEKLWDYLSLHGFLIEREELGT